MPRRVHGSVSLSEEIEMNLLASILLILVCGVLPGLRTASGGVLPKETSAAIDAAVLNAYRAAAAGFPCEVKGRGKPKMMRWEQVDRCLNDAANRVDWPAFSRQLETARSGTAEVTPAEFNAAVQASLSEHALPYDSVFVVKTKDEMLLPLTNSLLRFVPDDALTGLPVSDKVGTQVGTFTGLYAYERSGGLASANMFRLVLFQYTDKNGHVQSSSGRLLLDSFGVPWKDARSKKGFRLTMEKLKLENPAR
jgi:hypothetical protein